MHSLTPIQYAFPCIVNRLHLDFYQFVNIFTIEINEVKVKFIVCLI